MRFTDLLKVSTNCSYQMNEQLMRSGKCKLHDIKKDQLEPEEIGIVQGYFFVHGVYFIVKETFECNWSAIPLSLMRSAWLPDHPLVPQKISSNKGRKENGLFSQTRPSNFANPHNMLNRLTKATQRPSVR